MVHAVEYTHSHLNFVEIITVTVEDRHLTIFCTFQGVTKNLTTFVTAFVNAEEPAAFICLFLASTAGGLIASCTATKQYWQQQSSCICNDTQGGVIKAHNYC